jgi:hypothetical protein
LESFSKCLIYDARKRIEAKEAYLKKELQFGLEDGVSYKVQSERFCLQAAKTGAILRSRKYGIILHNAKNRIFVGKLE